MPIPIKVTLTEPDRGLFSRSRPDKIGASDVTTLLREPIRIPTEVVTLLLLDTAAAVLILMVDADVHKFASVRVPPLPKRDETVYDESRPKSPPQIVTNRAPLLGTLTKIIALGVGVENVMLADSVPGRNTDAVTAMARANDTPRPALAWTADSETHLEASAPLGPATRAIAERL